MEEVYRQHAVFVVVAEDIGVIAFYRGDTLFFLQLLYRGNQVTALGSAFVFLILSRFIHTLAETARKIGLPSFQE